MISKGHDDLKKMLTLLEGIEKSEGKSFKNSASFCPFIRSHFIFSRPLDSGTFPQKTLVLLFLRAKTTCYVQTTHLAGVEIKREEDERLSKE